MTNIGHYMRRLAWKNRGNLDEGAARAAGEIMADYADHRPLGDYPGE